MNASRVRCLGQEWLRLAEQIRNDSFGAVSERAVAACGDANQGGTYSDEPYCTLESREFGTAGRNKRMNTRKEGKIQRGGMLYRGEGEEEEERGKKGGGGRGGRSERRRLGQSPQRGTTTIQRMNALFHSSLYLYATIYLPLFDCPLFRLGLFSLGIDAMCYYCGLLPNS